MSNEHYLKLQRMYAKAPVLSLSTENDCRGSTCCHRDDNHRSDVSFSSRFHGSVYFKLLDDAAFFAANSIEFDVFVLTSDFHIRLLRPVSEGVLTATGKVIHSGRRNILAHSELHSEDGNLIAVDKVVFSFKNTTTT